MCIAQSQSHLRTPVLRSLAPRGSYATARCLLATLCSTKLALALRFVGAARRWDAQVRPNFPTFGLRLTASFLTLQSPHQSLLGCFTGVLSCSVPLDVHIGNICFGASDTHSDCSSGPDRTLVVPWRSRIRPASKHLLRYLIVTSATFCSDGLLLPPSFAPSVWIAPDGFLLHCCASRSAFAGRHVSL